MKEESRIKISKLYEEDDGFDEPDSEPQVCTVIDFLKEVYNNSENSIKKYNVLHEVEEAIKELRKSNKE